MSASLRERGAQCFRRRELTYNLSYWTAQSGHCAPMEHAVANVAETTSAALDLCPD